MLKRLMGKWRGGMVLFFLLVNFPSFSLCEAVVKSTIRVGKIQTKTKGIEGELLITISVPAGARNIRFARTSKYLGWLRGKS